MKDRQIVAEAKGVWKIFGARAKEALAAAMADNLSRREIFDQFGCVDAVRDVSIKVERGQIFCVMGLSGSGKSTLIRHFNRLLEPTVGEIFIGCENLGKKNDEELRAVRSKRIGMVFQGFALMPHRSVRENVALPLEINGLTRIERWETSEKALSLVGLEGWGDHYTDELSGGMQQRVGLARALASEPDLLLMDEPFSALDPLIRRQLQDEFLKLKSKMGITTIFITHDLDEAIRIGDQIAIMKDGKIVQIGKPKDIVQSPKDEYVAEFVSGISTINFVRALDIMRPMDLAKISAKDPQIVRPETTLADLLDLAISGAEYIAVKDGAQSLGIIESSDLLRGVRGSSAHER
jgi:glycine betaine/proline transport system ATP-binding protein